MVGATVSGVTVCCPECGGPLRVAFADGGSIIGCHRCGEAVRVPARPHPVETPDEAPSLLPPHATRQAVRGVRLLQVSLLLFAVEHVLLVGSFAVWIWLVGPAAVVGRDLGPLAVWLAFAVGLDAGLMAARTRIRWLGYRRCEPAAAAVGAAGWVRSARWAPVLRLVGYAGTFGPWVAGVPFNQIPPWGQALSAVATVLWFTGAVLEFAAVAAWGRLLAALGARHEAGRAVRYAVGVLGGLVVLTVGLSLVQMTAVTAARRADPLSRPRLALGDFPADAAPAVYGLALVACGVVAVLWLQYARLLAELRQRLRDG